MNVLMSCKICRRGSGLRLLGETRALHSCFHTIPSVEFRLPGHTRYAVITVINLPFFPLRVIQLHLPMGSAPCELDRLASLLVMPVMVPPGLCLVGNNSDEVDSCILAR